MREVVEFVRSHDAYFLIGLSAVSLILLVCVFSLSRKLAKLRARKNAKLEDGRVGDIVECLTELSDAVASLNERVVLVTAGQEEQANVLTECLHRIGVVRFNAFDDVGGEQSFALALLDGNKRGVIVSSLYGRQDSRFYAKEIVDGSGDRALSDEERKALQKAIS